MEIFNPGKFKYEKDNKYHYSDRIKITCLFDNEFIFIIYNYNEALIINYKTAISNLLKINEETLIKVNNEIFRYYKDSIKEHENAITILKPQDVWNHITFGKKLSVKYRKEDNLAYISIECECDWEIEHGLQIVLKTD